MDGVTIERRLREFFETRAQAEGIAAAWLFGSIARRVACARGFLEPHSVPVGVLFKDHSAEVDAVAQRQRGELESALGCAVQVLVLNRCQWLELMFSILQDHQLFFEGDRSTRIAFEVRTRNEFWDFEPYLRLYRSKNPG